VADADGVAVADGEAEGEGGGVVGATVGDGVGTSVGTTAVGSGEGAGVPRGGSVPHPARTTTVNPQRTRTHVRAGALIGSSYRGHPQHPR
jgi:hypothetical protein